MPPNDIEVDTSVSVGYDTDDHIMSNGLSSATSRSSLPPSLPSDHPPKMPAAARSEKFPWAKVFGYSAPADLARMRQICRSFKATLDDDAFWKQSRELHLPSHPPPVFGLSEYRMLQIAFSKRCMCCGRLGETSIYWPFRTRCCQPCLDANTIKEPALATQSPPIPEDALSALPFCIVDQHNCWMSTPSRYIPDIGLTRVFWRPDVMEKVVEQNDAVVNSREQQWLQEQSRLKSDNFRDLQRIETFKTNWRDWHTDGREIRVDASTDAESPTSTVTRRSVASTAVVATFGAVTARDQTLMKNRRRSEIEHRCLALDPPLRIKTLAQIPAYRSAIDIAEPMDDVAWENLLPKLQQQRTSVEQREHERESKRDRLKQGQVESRTRFGQHKRPSLGAGGYDDPREAQLRERLAKYADEEMFCYTDEASEETAPRFATNVLKHCRKRFYDNESGPGPRPLLLEHMKWVFDAKIAPLTTPIRRELFLCIHCPENMRRWALESLIQHFCAKHQPHATGVQPDWGLEWPEEGPYCADPSEVKQINHTVSSDGIGGESTGTGQTESGPTLGRHVVHPALSRHSAGNSSGSFVASHAEVPEEKLETIAADAREAWDQLDNIKDLPSSVRVYYAIITTAEKFKYKWSLNVPLHIFLKGLRSHPLMEPLKLADGISCLECFRNPQHRDSSADSFQFLTLMEHFQDVHVHNSLPGRNPHWIRDMVRLPKWSQVEQLKHCDGMDRRKYTMLAQVMPKGFNSKGLLRDPKYGRRPEPVGPWIDSDHLDRRGPPMSPGGWRDTSPHERTALSHNSSPRSVQHPLPMTGRADFRDGPPPPPLRGGPVEPELIHPHRRATVDGPSSAAAERDHFRRLPSDKAPQQYDARRRLSGDRNGYDYPGPRGRDYLPEPPVNRKPYTPGHARPDGRYEEPLPQSARGPLSGRYEPYSPSNGPDRRSRYDADRPPRSAARARSRSPARDDYYKERSPFLRPTPTHEREREMERRGRDYPPFYEPAYGGYDVAPPVRGPPPPPTYAERGYPAYRERSPVRHRDDYPYPPSAGPPEAYYEKRYTRDEARYPPPPPLPVPGGRNYDERYYRSYDNGYGGGGYSGHR